jgi:hypothetical protein
MDWTKAESLGKKPCSHCGECCLAVTCALGQALFLIGENDVCPAIEKEEKGLYYCGLICDTAKFISGLVGTEQWKIDLMHDVFVKLIGIGVGCTNGERTGKEHKIDKTFVDLLHEAVAEKSQCES